MSGLCFAPFCHPIPKCQKSFFTSHYLVIIASAHRYLLDFPSTPFFPSFLSFILFFWGGGGDRYQCWFSYKNLTFTFIQINILTRTDQTHLWEVVRYQLKDFSLEKLLVNTLRKMI